MKLLFTIIFSLFCFSLLGQRIKFNNEMVDTIMIKSHNSSFQFDKKGTTKGKADVYKIYYDSLDKKYIKQKYYRDEYQQTFRPKSFKINTTKRKSKNGVNQTNLQKLITAISTNIEPNKLIEQIDTTEIQGLVSKDRIKKIAKWHKIDWHFKRRYSTIEENKKFYKECQSMDTFKKYLANQFNNKFYTIVTDYSSTINIWITTTTSEYRFEGKYPNPFKMPWYNHNTHTKNSLAKPILNLNVNKSLESILPKGFLLRESLTTEALVDDYIEWYFKRRDMMF